MFRQLLSYDEAKKEIEKHLKPTPLGFEETSLLEAYNRVLAEDAISSLDIPPFNRSTVDGFAVKAEDTYGAEENQPVKLKVCGIVPIGELPKLVVAMGQAAEIVTGAPVPKGADAVIMVEDIHLQGDNLVVYSSVTKNENFQKKGSDIKTGETILKAGQSLGSREIGVLAALGKSRIKVFKVPAVAVLSTGGEVTEPGQNLRPGKIYDINAYSLCTAVRESGGTPVFAGVVPDEKEPLRKALEQALALADMVLTSGGVSVGPKDLVPVTVTSLGEPGLIFSGIAIKPGKPVTLGLVGKKPVFSFPGNPTSALLTFHLLARPVIQAMAGKTSGECISIKAYAGRRMFSAKGRRTFVTVKLNRNESNRLVAEPVDTGASGAITTLAKADGFVEIPENEQFVDLDEEVVVWLFKESP